VLARIERLPDDVKSWFQIVPELIEGYEWEVSISYVFTKVETVKHFTLYKGLLKRHRTDAQLTWDLLDKDHMSRSRFLDLYRIIFDEPIPSLITAHLAAAETVRDRVAHGKGVTDAQARFCLMEAFAFAQDFNDHVASSAGFRPFGEGRGIRGRAQPLGKETTRWVLRGMGIPPSNAKKPAAAS